jgi:hypothetical protein
VHIQRELDFATHECAQEQSGVLVGIHAKEFVNVWTVIALICFRRIAEHPVRALRFEKAKEFVELGAEVY